MVCAKSGFRRLRDYKKSKKVFLKVDFRYNNICLLALRAILGTTTFFVSRGEARSAFTHFSADRHYYGSTR